jgi:hypothetical protein
MTLTYVNHVCTHENACTPLPIDPLRTAETMRVNHTANRYEFQRLKLSRLVEAILSVNRRPKRS